MKKAFFILLFLCFSSLQNCFANADIEKIYDKHQVVYLPSNNVFVTGAISDDRIVLTKISSVGTGGYSSYFYSNGKLAFELSSNFEFIKKGKLIAVDNANFKYYEVYYKNNAFCIKKLTFRDVKKIFPNAQPVKISKFKNGRLTYRAKSSHILLFNNTDEYFHRYSTTPSDIQSADIKGLINVAKVKNITFSHYNDNNEIYKKYEIIVK